MIVAIDSNILIYAGHAPKDSNKKEGDEGEEIKRLRKSAKIIFYIHRDDTFVLPTVAIGEVLVPIEESRKPKLINELTNKFICPEFNIRAASIASSLVARNKSQPSKDRYAKRDRHILKADAMIIASAKVAGAAKFYSADSKCRKLARTIMEAPELPTSIPENLYSDEILDDF